MSNNTFRLSDWGRVDAHGKPRPLHIHQGVQAIDYSRGPVGPTRGRPTEKPGVTRLVECEQFVLDHWHLDGHDRMEDGNCFQILTVVQGQLTVGGDVMAPLRRGQTLLIPASCTPVDLAPAASQRSSSSSLSLP